MRKRDSKAINSDSIFCKEKKKMPQEVYILGIWGMKNIVKLFQSVFLKLKHPKSEYFPACLLSKGFFLNSETVRKLPACPSFEICREYSLSAQKHNRYYVCVIFLSVLAFVPKLFSLYSEL